MMLHFYCSLSRRTNQLSVFDFTLTTATRLGCEYLITTQRLNMSTFNLFWSCIYEAHSMEPRSSASVIHCTTQKRAREERNWFWLVNCLAKSIWQNNAPFGVGRWKTLGTRLHGVNKLLRTVQTLPYPRCLLSSWHSVASWMPGIAQTVDIFSVLLYSASYPLRPHPSISTFQPQRKHKTKSTVHLDSFE